VIWTYTDHNLLILGLFGILGPDTVIMQTCMTPWYLLPTQKANVANPALPSIEVWPFPLDCDVTDSPLTQGGTAVHLWCDDVTNAVSCTISYVCPHAVIATPNQPQFPQYQRVFLYIHIICHTKSEDAVEEQMGIETTNSVHAAML